jgi:hypothetical protein
LERGVGAQAYQGIGAAGAEKDGIDMGEIRLTGELSRQS